MEIKYKIDKAEYFSTAEKNCFLELIIRQGKVSEPTIEKIESCPYLCMASYDSKIIGIGALKQIYMTPFDNAGVPDLKSKFNIELGYLYVLDNQDGISFRGLGIGKSITRFLLSHTKNKNIFATTESKESNPMLHILRNFGFTSIGNPYIGHKTHDIITLMILIHE
jgi:hypothetical protein